MKKYFMTLMAVILGVGMLNAHPVDVNRAKMVGQQFVLANYEQNRQNVELELVYTGASTRGEACFYVFNVGSEGFVAVSADDAFRPIVGYSKEEAFDPQNINPALDCRSTVAVRLSVWFLPSGIRIILTTTIAHKPLAVPAVAPMQVVSPRQWVR